MICRMIYRLPQRCSSSRPVDRYFNPRYCFATQIITIDKISNKQTTLANKRKSPFFQERKLNLSTYIPHSERNKELLSQNDISNVLAIWQSSRLLVVFSSISVSSSKQMNYDYMSVEYYSWLRFWLSLCKLFKVC
jgi:hypothetical protein